MAYKLLLPKFGMAMESAKVVGWKKDLGDFVEKDEAVLSVENEKLTSDIVSMESGTLIKKVAEVGRKYLVGDVLAYLGEAGETIDDSAVDSRIHPGAAQMNAGAIEPRDIAEPSEARIITGFGTKPNNRVVASPLAKKIAAQLGVDISEVPGSGSGGRIEKADVERYANSIKPPHSESAPEALPDFEPDYTIIPYRGMRKAIGANMLQSWTNAPMVTHHVKVDAGAVLDICKTINQGVNESVDKITINDILLKLTATALKKSPAINASLQGNEIHVFKRVHLGVAVALENGLIVPVIRDADRKRLQEISADARRLISKAREQTLSPDDISGGTFTISNLGGYGSVDEFTPIVNPPQAAILGVGRTVDTPVFKDGDVVVRPMTTLSFTYDHRVIDGAVAAQFIKILMDLLVEPDQALCE